MRLAERERERDKQWKSIALEMKMGSGLQELRESTGMSQDENPSFRRNSVAAAACTRALPV